MKKNIRTTSGKTHRRKPVAFGFRFFSGFLRNRKAANAVISNLILIAAVIVIGFAALQYVSSTSNAYVSQYSKTVNTDIDRLKEGLACEYIYYDSVARSLTVYVINNGRINLVNFTAIYVGSSSWNTTVSSASFDIKYLVSNSVTSHLNIGEEGYVQLSLSPASLLSGHSYKLKITTWRGSVFEYTFVA